MMTFEQFQTTVNNQFQVNRGRIQYINLGNGYQALFENGCKIQYSIGMNQWAYLYNGILGIGDSLNNAAKDYAQQRDAIILGK